MGDLTLWMKPPVNADNYINSPGRFFHYEPLFTSSFSKNLIIPEAAMFSKGQDVTIISGFVNCLFKI